MRNDRASENRTVETKTTTVRTDANRDPITGAPGAHPVGTGVGATGGGATGAAIGAAVGGPVGAAVGLAVGAVAGGLAGKGAAEAVNPTAEEAYWRDNYNRADFYNKSYTYDDYSPALRTGYEGYSRYGTQGKTWEQVEPSLRTDYDRVKGKSRLEWEQAKAATRSAWHRVERALPGDADNDGR
jgi:uncharacterized protein YcfJ